jgi:multicomponent Na+:H+ antiporter subunit C
MEVVIAIVVGGLFAGSIYLLLRRSMVRLLIGLILLSNAVNLLIFSMGRMTRGEAPMIPLGQPVPTAAIANPLPQALILTAIVIGFGLLAFMMVLTYRTYAELGTVNTDEMRLAEPPYPGERVSEDTVTPTAKDEGPYA